jgi:hypothetical protein
MKNYLNGPPVRNAEKALERIPFNESLRWLQGYRSACLNFSVSMA